MKLLTFSASVVLGTAAALAVPAKPTPFIFTQPDGTTVTVQLRGDERHHWYQTLDGYVLVNKDNTLYYGEADSSGHVYATTLKATEIEQRSGLVKSYLTGVDNTVMLEALDFQRSQSPRLKSEQEYLRRARATEKAKASATKDPTIEDVYGKGLFSGSHFPVQGEQKGLVILVEYQDVKFTEPEVNYGGNVQGYYTEMLNGENFTRHNATGSARKWFIDNSNGQFLPEFDVYGPVTLSREMKYYGGNDYLGDDQNPALMIAEACQLLDADIDYTQYDRDGDGYIDNVYVIYAGRGEASGGSSDTVWPHSWNVSAAGIGSYYFDDKKLDRYACSNEWEGTAPDGIGTFVHEFSHVLGLPDIYPTSYTEAFTPGAYCVMDYGNYNNDGRTPPNYGIFERNALGWMKPVQLTGDVMADFTIEPISNMSGYAVVTNRADEFFLFENRQQTGWDKYIPGHGMLVWHIDYNTSIWTSNTVNNDKDHQCVDIVEADDVRSKESQMADPFPGTRNVTSFTHRTSPAMKTWAGTELKVPLRDIREVDGNIIFSGGYIPIPAPGVITAYEPEPENITTSSFEARWSKDENAQYYLVNVYDENHRLIWNRRNVGDTDRTFITGLKPGNTYYYNVMPCNEDTDGEPSNDVMVTTLPPTLDYLTTSALEATEIGETCFTANWDTFDIATDYIINITKQEATPLLEATADFNELPDGWRTNAGFTDDPSLCGSTAPALYFDKKGYLMTSQYDENIRKVYFNLVIENATVGSQLRVMGTSPGSYAWKEIEIIDLDEFIGRQFSNFNVPEDIRGLYIEFAPVGDCKVAIDDLRIIYGGTVRESSQHEIYTNYSAGNVSSLKIENLVPDTQYEYNVQAVNDTHHARVSNTIVVRTRELSGVEEVAIDNSDMPAEYYNLQGIKVTHPIPGHIYIMRNGSASSKVIFTE